MCVCVRACVPACVRACLPACLSVCLYESQSYIINHSPINKSDKPAHFSEAGVDHCPAFHCTAETVASTARHIG